MKTRIYAAPAVEGLSPHDALKHFHIPEDRFSFPTARGFRIKISMKVVCQYMEI